MVATPEIFIIRSFIKKKSAQTLNGCVSLDKTLGYSEP